MAEKSRISNIRKRITDNTKLTKKKAMAEIIEYLTKNHPKIDVSGKSPHLKYIDNDIANEMFEAITGRINSALDFRERLYLFFKSGGGKHKIPVDLEPQSDRHWVELFVNDFGILELGAYKKELDCEKHTLKEYAEYLIKYRGAVEITQEEAMKKIKGQAVIRRVGTTSIDVDLTNTDDNPVELGRLPVTGDDAERDTA